MADFPIELPAGLGAPLARSIDPEAKIPRALDALGSLGDRDVALVDADAGLRARQLIELGARVTAVVRPGERARFESGAVQAGDRARIAGVVEGTAARLPLADGSVDAIVACWSAFRGASEPEVAEADRVLRPGGRLLVLHDYGRDDVSTLWPERQADQLAWSRRDGWFLRSGFRIRVIHCWWTFDSIEEAQERLVEVAGARGSALASRLKRPRLSYNVAVYHRTRGGGTEGDEAVADGAVAAGGNGQTPALV